MAIRAQGTQLFFIDPDALAEDRIVKVNCPTGINSGDESTQDLDVTCLEEEEMEQTMSGLTGPSNATFSINIDDRQDSHYRLYELKIENPRRVIKFAIGFSGSKAAPTLNGTGDDFVFPDERAWVYFDGEVTTFPFSIQKGTIINGEVAIKKRTPNRWVRREMISS